MQLAIDFKSLVTVFLGIWTLVIVCIVIGMYRYVIVINRYRYIGNLSLYYKITDRVRPISLYRYRYNY